MRITFILIFVILVGAFLGAGLLIGNPMPSPQELPQVKTSCLECHSVSLRYNSIDRIHDLHSTLSCSQCHTGTDLPATDKVHNYLEWAGLVLVILSLAAIISNFVISRIRLKKGQQ